MRGLAVASALFLMHASLPTPAPAAPVPFTAVIHLELPDLTQVVIGSAAGSAERLSDGSLIFPPQALVTAAPVLTTPPGPSCVTSLLVSPSGFGAGTLATSSEGFGGPLRISGSFVADALASAPLGLSLPLAIGNLASPATGSYATTAATSQPPAQALVTLSFSRFGTALADLTGTVQGLTTSQRQLGGSLVTTSGGDQILSLVSPMHVYVNQIDPAGATKRRTIALAGRAVIAVPSPPWLVGEATGLGALCAIGLWRRQRLARSAQREAP